MFSNILYGIYDGSDFTYVGKTTRPIEQRRSEHIKTGNFNPSTDLFMILDSFETPHELGLAEKEVIQNGWDKGMCSRNKKRG